MSMIRRQYRPRTVGFSAINAYRGYQRLARATRLARSRTRTVTRMRKKVRSGVGVTTQHDSRFIYRKRRMPRRQRRRWKSFVRKVNAVNERDMGTRTVVFSAYTDMTSTSAPDQSVFSFSLYGQRSSLGIHNDLRAISLLENSGDPTAAAGNTVNQTSHVFFQSAVMDVTFRNTSTFRSSGVLVPAPEAQLELDVYEISCRQDFTTAGSNYDSLGAAFLNEGNQELKIGNAAGYSTITPQLRGVTPFDQPTALSRLGVKIWKKTKYFIPNGNTITYQMRDPKRHTCLRRELNDELGANKPGWTRWLYVVYKLVPELLKGSVDNTYQETLAVGITRKYMYKIEGVPENRNAYLAQNYTTTNPN